MKTNTIKYYICIISKAGGSFTGNSDFSIVKDDVAQPAGTLKYYLKAKGYKIASFTFNVHTKEGTLIVALQ